MMHEQELVRMGYDATRAALVHLDTMLAALGGIFLRTEVEIVVERWRTAARQQRSRDSPSVQTGIR